jgi:hypothetical protein
MSEVGFANGTHGFCAQHTVRAVNPFFDGSVVAGLVKTGPSATCIKFGFRVE